MAATLFLDRDGVINADSSSYIKSVGEWRPLPGSLEAIARLTQADYQIVVLTNQSGVARGLFSTETLDAIHEEMTRQIERAGGRLAGIFHCPHDERADCVCRKPKTGLIDLACERLGCDARGVPLVGDRESDLEAARTAGCRPILILPSGERPDWVESARWSDVEIYPDLAAVAIDLLSA